MLSTFLRSFSRPSASVADHATDAIAAPNPEIADPGPKIAAPGPERAASGRGAATVPVDDAPAIGRGTTLAFSFADDRDEVPYTAGDPGQYGGHYDSQYDGPTINAERLRLTIEQELRDGLRRKDYRLVPSGSPADAEVCFRLRAFRYDFEQCVWTDSGNGAVVIAVEARRPAFRYATVYRANRPRPRAGGAFTQDTQMRATLRDVLTAAASDEGLDAFLTARE
jgi:hypothetical protein